MDEEVEAWDVCFSKCQDYYASMGCWGFAISVKSIRLPTMSYLPHSFIEIYKFCEVLLQWYGGDEKCSVSHDNLFSFQYTSEDFWWYLCIMHIKVLSCLKCLYTMKKICCVIKLLSNADINIFNLQVQCLFPFLKKKINSKNSKQMLRNNPICEFLSEKLFFDPTFLPIRYL